MKFYILILTLIMTITFQAYPQKKVIGYINGMTYPASTLDFNSLTHIAHAFLIPNADGTIKVDSWYPSSELLTTAHANGAKVVAAVGGYGQSDGFFTMAANASLRAKFIDALYKYIKDNGYDGADIDWEYPKGGDRNNFTALIREMRIKFGSDLSISIAIPSQDWNNAYDIAVLKDLVDWFGIMTYDFGGSWENRAYHNSSLYALGGQPSGMDKSAKHYSAKGMPADKMCLGIPFGGYSRKASGLFQTASGGGYVTYTAANALQVFSGYKYNWDDQNKAPYLISADNQTFITYEDTISAKLKGEYINQNDYAGIIIWKLWGDFSNNKNHILSTLGKYLINYPKTAPAEPALSKPADGLSVSSENLTLIWKAADSTTSYDLQLSKDENFGNYIVNKSGINMTFYPVAGLEANTQYYWRVRAANLAGSSAWSKVFTFTTEGITSVLDNVVPDKMELSSFPNPFNPVTTIRFTVPQKSTVEIVVYNALGSEVAELYKGEKAAGTYEVNFNAAEHPSGIFFVRMTTGSGVEVRKMMLLK